MITQQQVIDEARTWVGVPFLHQGRTRQGVDCIGLAIVVGKSLGMLPEDFERRHYGRLPHHNLLVQSIQEYCSELFAPLPASLLVIRWTGEPYHVAICTGPTIIHSNSTVGRVVEHGYRHPWPKMTASCWALPKVKYE